MRAIQLTTWAVVALVSLFMIFIVSDFVGPNTHYIISATFFFTTFWVTTHFFRTCTSRGLSGFKSFLWPLLQSYTLTAVMVALGLSLSSDFQEIEQIAKSVLPLAYVLGFFGILVVLINSTLDEHNKRLVADQHGAPVISRTAIKRQLTENDRQVVASHEAGHVIAFATLGSLPEAFSANIAGSTEYKTPGCVPFLHSKHCLPPKEYSEWLMLLFLAGKVGESFLLGRESMNCSSDIERWDHEATNYLTCQSDGRYPACASTTLELELQREQHEKLAAIQTSLLEELFEANRGVLIEVRDALLQKGTLSKKDINPLFKDFVIPNEWPDLIGRSDHFNDEWPEHADYYVIANPVEE